MTAIEYITEVWNPPADNGRHALHSHMPEPEPLSKPDPYADHAAPVAEQMLNGPWPDPEPEPEAEI